MSDVKEIREQMARIATNARSKFDEITSETPAERAAEIEREFDAMMADHDKLSANLERAKKLGDATRAAEQFIEDRRPNFEGRASASGQEKEITYDDAFYSMLRMGGDTSALSQEHRSVLRRGYDKEARIQTAGTTTAGGYTIPTTLADFINIAMIATGPMWDDNLCTVLPTASGNSFKIPTIDDTTVAAVAHTEGTALTDDGGSDVTFGQKSLDAYAFDTEFVKWSLELEQDSNFVMETLLKNLLGMRLGRIANAQLTTGTGSSAPNGIVTASTAGKTAASTSAITADEILEFVHSVDPAYRASPKARIMFNDTTLLALRKLKDGQSNYLLQTAPDGSGRLVIGALSVPYVINQSMASAAAAAKVMVYGDFSQYYVRKVGSPILGVMKEKFWPDIGIAGLVRFDGELGNTAAVKHYKMAAS